MNHYVMDYETLINLFGAVFQHYKTGETKQFVVHRLRNNFPELVDFLLENRDSEEWHISYNGLNFDAQITEFILRNADELINEDALTIATNIYNFAQSVIEKTSNNEFPPFAPHELSIPQIDVFKLNHWDNAAKRSSLKWIQYSMDWFNIQEMPIHHSTYIHTQAQINEIMTYCVNDVESCRQIMNLSKDQIKLRKSLTEEYSINLYSASEPKIAKELFLMFLSKKTHKTKSELKSLRTRRENIVVKDIILPYIKFERSEFIAIHEKFKELIINTTETKGGFKYSLVHKGVRTDFGLGGVHGARSSGIYESKDGMIIMTSDVTSFYPNLAIRNRWSPAHLPVKEFCEQYEWFFDERVKIPKKDPKNYVYKIILNSTYGLSNDENSILYDPEFTMRITINGQLSLSMLYEMICEEIPNAIPLMQNTDGLETMIPREYVDKYMEICRRWEDITQLQLEHDTYSKIILGDVNNYIAITEDGKSKCKGRFEYDNLALHKNKSFLIIPKAIHAYFVDGIQPEDFLAQNQNIFDYCGGVKIKGDWNFHEHKIVNGEHSIEPIQHTIRYFVSNSGSKIIKKNNSDGREIQVEAGKWMQTIMIDYTEKEFSEYDINFKYYLDNIYKEIRSLEPINNQLSLF